MAGKNKQKNQQRKNPKSRKGKKQKKLRQQRQKLQADKSKAAPVSLLTEPETDSEVQIPIQDDQDDKIKQEKTETPQTTHAPLSWTERQAAQKREIEALFADFQVEVASEEQQQEQMQKYHMCGIFQNEFRVISPGSYPVYSSYEIKSSYGEEKEYWIECFARDSNTESYSSKDVSPRTKHLKTAKKWLQKLCVAKRTDRKYPEFGTHGIVWWGYVISGRGSLKRNLDEDWYAAKSSYY